MRPEDRWRAVADKLPGLQKAAERALLRAYTRALEKIIKETETVAAGYRGGPAPQLVRLLELRGRIETQIEALTGSAIVETSALRARAVTAGYVMARDAFMSGGVPRGTFSAFSPASVEAAVFSPYSSISRIKTFPALADMSAQAGGRYDGMTVQQVYQATADAAKGTAEYAINRTSAVLMERVWESVQSGIIRGIGQNKLAGEIADVYKGAAVYMARRVARTETHKAQILGSCVAAQQITEAGGQIRRFWIASGDDRTRASHLAMNGTFEDVAVGGWHQLDEDGNDTGEIVDAPGLSPDPAESINCRCAIGFAVEGLTTEGGGRKQLDTDE